MRHTAIDDRGLGHGPASAGPTQDARVGSQMTPHAKSGNLLYVWGMGQETYILSFPKGELIGQISGGATFAQTMRAMSGSLATRVGSATNLLSLPAVE